MRPWQRACRCASRPEAVVVGPLGTRPEPPHTDVREVSHMDTESRLRNSWSRTACEMVRRIALAVLRLMTRSNLVWLRYRQFARFVSLEDLVHITCSSAPQFREIRPVGQQAPGRHIFPKTKNSGKAIE
jgi:hypothetical protein